MLPPSRKSSTTFRNMSLRIGSMRLFEKRGEARVSMVSRSKLYFAAQEDQIANPRIAVAAQNRPEARVQVLIRHRNRCLTADSVGFGVARVHTTRRQNRNRRRVDYAPGRHALA